MPETYDNWVIRAEQTVRHLVKDGHEVHKVDVDVEEFINWAAKENVPITGYARIEFANQKLGKKELERLTSTDMPNPTRAELKRTMRAASGMDLSEIWAPYLRRPEAAVCPIFRSTNAGPEQIGSGVLLNVGDVSFLLTAAHVTDERKRSDLLIPSKTGFVNLFGLFIELAISPNQTRNDDKLDVAVVRLSHDLVARIHDSLLFLDHADCDLTDQTTAGDAYTIVGYPARKSERGNQRVSSEIFALSGEGVSDKRFDQLALDRKHHLVVQYRPKRAIRYATMRRSRTPHPEGMSGGGMFAWHKDLPKLSALGQPKLAAIVTEYHQHKNVFVGTRLSAYLIAMHRNDPTLPIVPIR
jgi:hypothetical protein